MQRACGCSRGLRIQVLSDNFGLIFIVGGFYP
jgi:hypothetical protein